eukprot:TRINITY_DN5640_c0_g1_i2.p1 TRINITY_DN5640_c0_g1~~TRINITY_DN5640_c0_g1_i2.p1  ORF type:complete len:1285 (-),score=183.26 TRINITY_DN5640_c0_g1_i2:221-4075(-)
MSCRTVATVAFVSALMQEVQAEVQEEEPKTTYYEYLHLYKEAMCNEYHAKKAKYEGYSSWAYTLPQYWECDYPTCAGLQQSPVNMNDAYAVGPPGGSHDRRLEEAETLYSFMKSETFDGWVDNTGHGLQVTHNLGTFEYPHYDIYKGLQFHLHCPSEHALEGALYACELHLVHQKHGASGADDLVVLGVLFKLGEENGLLKKMGLPTGAPAASEKVEIKNVNCQSDFEAALKGHYYHYVGSLTTPPCSETVMWFVLKDPLSVSWEQVEAFGKLYPHPANNRPLQGFYARQVYKDHVSGCYAEGRQYGHNWDYVLPGCWPALGYPLCAGIRQSPMHIDSHALTTLGGGEETIKSVTDYKAVEGCATHNTGHGYQINAPGSYGTFLYEAQKYHALQCHLHVPAEHAIDGLLYEAELHIVHQKVASTGLENLLVIGIMFKKGDPSSFLQKMGLPQGAPEDFTGEEKFAFEGPLDLGTEFADAFAGDYYRYDGSLTTPPCEETVKWFVTIVCLTISQAQLDAHHRVFKQPFMDRPPQLRHGRPLGKNSFDPGFAPADAGEFGCTAEGYNPPAALTAVAVRRLEAKQDWTYLFADCWAVSYPHCGGRTQSPIDVNSKGKFVGKGAAAINLLKYSKYDEVGDCHIRNTGHGLQTESISGQPFGYLKIDGSKYIALQYHIHCPSEHTIDGAFYTCEVHAVHQGEGAKGLEDLLVWGVLYKVGGAINDIFIDHFVKAAHLEKGETWPLDEDIRLRDYHELRDGFYRYDGSLTTPPCAETVKWFLLISVATMTQDYADILLAAMRYPNLNNRPIQAQYGRGIWKNSLPGCYFPSSGADESSGDRRLAVAPWDYLMPQCWAPAYPECYGTAQSPINFETKYIVDKGSDRIYLQHDSVNDFEWKNTGHGLQVDYEQGYVIFNEIKYKTLQLHLHMPSEHAVNGELYAAELHVVHQKEGAEHLEDLLVCGIMYKLGDESNFLSHVFPVLAGKPDKTIDFLVLDFEMEPAAADGFYAYGGSLTTPPCSETVQWVVFKKCLTVGREQVGIFHDLFAKPQNNRPLQPPFGRTVVEDSFKPLKILKCKKDQCSTTYFSVSVIEVHKSSYCHPVEALVTVEGPERMPLAEIKPGTKLLVRMPSGEMAFRPVLSLLHDHIDAEAGLVDIEHDAGTLRATPLHLIFKKVSDGVLVSTSAAEVKVGDVLVTDSSASAETVVLSVSKDVAMNGVRTPLTAAGTTLVDGAVASVYASLNRVAALHCSLHSSFFLVRVLAHVLPSWTSFPGSLSLNGLLRVISPATQ